MDVLKTLNSYQELIAETDIARDAYLELHRDIGSGAINYDGMPHGTKISSRTEYDAIRLNEKYFEYFDKYNEMQKRMCEIERMISTISRWQSRYVIHEHYVMLRPLNAIKDDELLCVSDSTVRRYHRQGIYELRQRYELSVKD